MMPSLSLPLSAKDWDCLKEMKSVIYFRLFNWKVVIIDYNEACIILLIFIPLCLYNTMDICSVWLIFTFWLSWKKYNVLNGIISIQMAKGLKPTMLLLLNLCWWGEWKAESELDLGPLLLQSATPYVPRHVLISFHYFIGKRALTFCHVTWQTHSCQSWAYLSTLYLWKHHHTD